MIEEPWLRQRVWEGVGKLGENGCAVVRRRTLKRSTNIYGDRDTLNGTGADKVFEKAVQCDSAPNLYTFLCTRSCKRI